MRVKYKVLIVLQETTNHLTPKPDENSMVSIFIRIIGNG